MTKTETIPKPQEEQMLKGNAFHLELYTSFIVSKIGIGKRFRLAYFQKKNLPPILPHSGNYIFKNQTVKQDTGNAVVDSFLILKFTMLSESLKCLLVHAFIIKISTP